VRPQFFEQQFHCVVCTALIPPDKLKFKATTCSDECARLRKLALRARQDMRECRFCRKPMTMADKKAFQRFRRWEAANPSAAYPAQWAKYMVRPEQMSDEEYRTRGDAFTLAIAQQMAQEDEDAGERTSTAKVETQAAVEPVRETVAEV